MLIIIHMVLLSGFTVSSDFFLVGSIESVVVASTIEPFPVD